MKKIFTFIAAMLVAFAASAATININTGTADALRVALNSANDGDEIVMAAGTYVESNSNFIAFAGKHVTVKAAEGAIVILQPQVSITVSGGGCAHFKNIRIDAAHIRDAEGAWYEHIIYPADDNVNNSIILDGCEIYGFPLNKSFIHRASTEQGLGSVTVNNCYIHDIMKSFIFIENTASANVTVTNSTFANITTVTDSYYAGIIDSRATSGTFSVDHCTFYNAQVMNTDYAAVGKVSTPGATVSNCIFSLPASQDNIRAIRDVSAANNCLTFNYLKDSGKGIHSDVTKNACIFGQDPLFADAANGDFTLGATSPALGAGTDGSNLGDPFWWPREIYFYNALGWTAPHVNFYVGSYWDNAKGSGNYTTSPQVGKPNVAMTQVGTSNVWKANYSGLYNYVSFTSESQDNMGNFWSIAGASYRGDFDPESEWNMFVPNTTSNGTYNGVNYYSNGLWAPYTITYADLNYKTLCLPVGGTLTGANAYEVTAVDDVNGVVTLSDATTTLTAGVAYIIKPTANTISIAYAGAPVFTGVMNYLRGNLVAPQGWHADASWQAYILINNEFCKIEESATADIALYKAFLKVTDSSAPSVLRIINGATNIENIEGNETAVKFIENGKLFIKKNGVVYDAVGTVVK